VPLVGLYGAPHTAGRYQLEAWINSGDSGSQFAATAPFTIEDPPKP
jgi:hypothetical protein